MRTLGFCLHKKPTIMGHEGWDAGRQYATFRKSPSAPKPAPKRQDPVSLARIMLEDMVKIEDLTKDSVFTFSKDDYMQCLHVASKQVMSNSPRWLQAVPSGMLTSLPLLQCASLPTILTPGY
jgi:hypothetical protein